MADPEDFDISANEWQDRMDDEEFRAIFESKLEEYKGTELDVLIGTSIDLLYDRTPECMDLGQIKRYVRGDEEVIKQFKKHAESCKDYCAKMLFAQHRYLAWKEMTGRDE